MTTSLISPAGTQFDPVCGMFIPMLTAAASRPAGKTIVYFCSARCAERFDAAPGRYLAPDGTPKGPVLWTRPAGGPVRVELPVTGLTRAGGPALAQAIEDLPGVHAAYVNAPARRVLVEYDAVRTTATRLVQAVREAGYETGSGSL